jgi:mono/diheme cytochrome c family protein
MKRLLVILGVEAVIVAVVAVLAWWLVLPNLNWAADARPGVLETWLANSVRGHWVREHASQRANPISPTADNLKMGEKEFDHHCAFCHGVLANGKNQIEANYYPPVPRLTGSTQKMSDAQIYFVIAKGVGNTAMPSFERHHSPDDIWRIVLWVRHLARLSPAEKARIEAQSQAEAEEHEQTMGHDARRRQPR